ncbi:MAG: hypothetical protein M0P74_00815 [Syntrophales bacterium]|jgi:hypothetical protein|nr:hypothetical protein [Syntrophales bacterium]
MNRETVPIHLIHYDSEPEMPVLGGPLCLGYQAYMAGRPERCREMIAAFLAQVYASPARQRERSTEIFVRDIYQKRRIVMPALKRDADPWIVLEAAGMRCDAYHIPLVQSIVLCGYDPTMGTAITMIERDGLYLVGDGKNRCSILAALGHETVPNVEVRK